MFTLVLVLQHTRNRASAESCSIMLIMSAETVLGEKIQVWLLVRSEWSYLDYHAAPVCYCNFYCFTSADVQIRPIHVEPVTTPLGQSN